MLLKLAFRNIWRNKGRSLITIASILFAVLFASFMNSFQKGAWDRMLDNVVNYYYGYAQIHKNGYWEDKDINKSFLFSESFQQLVTDVDEIKGITPRLESFALASFGTQTSGMLVVGSDPAMEHELTELKGKLVSGEYFKKDNREIMIGEGVGELLKIGVGDTLILISQGYHGVNAAGKYPVCGMVKFPSPDLNKKMIYLPLTEAQYFFGADNRVTSVALNLESKDDIPHAFTALESKLGAEEYSLMDWKEMIPELVNAQKTDAAGNYIFILVLYAIIAFGIFGTIMMMAKEREYEFGVLIAVGMKRRILAFTTWLEVVILSLIGSVAGILLCIPLVYYFHVNPLDFSKMGEGNDNRMEAYEKWGFDPIMPTAFEFDLFFFQAVIVFIIASLLATYAIYQILKLKPVDAMRAM